MMTVIIAAKDSEKWLPRTIESLKSQIYEDWECILSVNGSSDKTLDIASSLNDSRFCVINSEVSNKSSALNRALMLSKREWILILDADDLWDVNKLSKQLSFLTMNKHIDIVGTQMTYIDENDNEILGAPSLPLFHDEIVCNLIANNNSIANSSVCYRKSIHDKVGYYDTEMFGVEDYDMWKRCARWGMKFANLNEKLFYHRLHKGSNYNSRARQTQLKHLVDAIDHTHRRMLEAT